MARRRSATVFWLLVAVAATGLMTTLSRPVWEAIPLLAYVQFPWRWLSVQALALAMLAAPLGVVRLGRVWVAAAALALTAAVLIPLRVETLGVHDASADDIRAFELLSGNLGSTVRAEYLPVDVVPRPMSSVHAVSGGEGLPRAVEAGDAVDQATLVDREPAAQIWHIQVSGDGNVPVAFPTFALDGWTATVRPMAEGFADPAGADTAGVPQPVSAIPGSGWLTVKLTPGLHEVRLAFGRDTVRAVAECLSLAAAGVLAAAVLLDRRRRLARGALVVVAAAILLVAVAKLMPTAEERGPRTQDTLRAAWPRYHEHGILYGTSRLVRAVPLGDRVKAGEAVTLELGWENALAAQTVEAALVTPAEPVNGVPDVRAGAEQIQTDPMPLRLPVGQDVPSGAYFVRLRVAAKGGQTVAPRDLAGHDLGTVYVGPVWVTGNGDFRDRPAQPLARMDDISLQTVETADTGSSLEVTMVWEAERLLASDYKTSVRLVHDGDEVLAQEDTMPLYGFLPTTAWQARQQILDRRWLALPADLPSGGDYSVVVVLYDELSGAEIGTARVGGVEVLRGG
jgi:hypothetical protein